MATEFADCELLAEWLVGSSESLWMSTQFVMMLNEQEMLSFIPENGVGFH